MKKILSLLLAMIMVFSLATVAFAEGEGEGNGEGGTTQQPETPAAKVAASKEATYNAMLDKIYTVAGATNTAIFPTETLEFTSVAATTNPDGGAANLTVNDLVVSTNESQYLTFNVPSLNKVGTYHFTISETAGDAQGVTYTTGSIAVSVLVTYDYDDTDNDGYTMTATVGVTKAADESKEDTFTNLYDLGSLAVSKTVTGNLGDTSKYFDVKVTLKAAEGKTVESAITVSGGSDASNSQTIAADWTGKKEVTIKLKHGETVTFSDIPAGVTYTVEESDYTGGDKNGENGYDAADYAYSDNGKAIAKGDTDTVGITNNKATNVDTGIALDSAPYFLMLAVALFGMVALVSKKRYEV